MGLLHHDNMPSLAIAPHTPGTIPSDTPPQGLSNRSQQLQPSLCILCCALKPTRNDGGKQVMPSPDRVGAEFQWERCGGSARGEFLNFDGEGGFRRAKKDAPSMFTVFSSTGISCRLPRILTVPSWNGAGYGVKWTRPSIRHCSRQKALSCGAAIVEWIP